MNFTFEISEDKVIFRKLNNGYKIILDINSFDTVWHIKEFEGTNRSIGIALMNNLISIWKSNNTRDLFELTIEEFERMKDMIVDSKLKIKDKDTPVVIQHNKLSFIVRNDEVIFSENDKPIFNLKLETFNIIANALPFMNELESSYFPEFGTALIGVIKHYSGEIRMWRNQDVNNPLTISNLHHFDEIKKMILEEVQKQKKTKYRVTIQNDEVTIFNNDMPFLLKLETFNQVASAIPHIENGNWRQFRNENKELGSPGYVNVIKSFSGEIRIWKVNTTNELLCLHHFDEIKKMVFEEVEKLSPCRKEIDKDGTIRTFNKLTNKSHSFNDEPSVICKDGTKYWYKEGLQHRDNDLPAVECPSRGKFWFKEGNLHRDNDLPAVERINGTKEWFKEGKEYKPDLKNHSLSKTDVSDNNENEYKVNNLTVTLKTKDIEEEYQPQPIEMTKVYHEVTDHYGVIRTYNKLTHKLHSFNDEPAAIYKNGIKLWYKEGLLHRDNDLPASIQADGSKRYFKNDQEYYPSKKDEIKSITISNNETKQTIDLNIKSFLAIKNGEFITLFPGMPSVRSKRIDDIIITQNAIDVSIWKENKPPFVLSIINFNAINKFIENNDKKEFIITLNKEDLRLLNKVFQSTLYPQVFQSTLYTQSKDLYDKIVKQTGM